jgi:glycine cleavage system transcriptional repressor
MAKTVVLTGVGRDRVGIVAELTELLFELGCNLLDSSMTLLRGEFAIIVMAEVPADVSTSQLENQLERIEKHLGMKIHVRELSATELEDIPLMSENQFIVSVYGADKPGIVTRVTRALADNGINITDVQTKSAGGAKKIFVMILEVSAPSPVSFGKLESMMIETAKTIGVDISVQSLDVVEL